MGGGLAGPRAVLGAAVLLALSACGNQGAGQVTDRAITSRAIAAVMLDHLPAGTSRREATYVDEHSPPSYVGADFRYHADGESDGDLVRVTLQRARALPRCDEVSRCVDLGQGTRMSWQRLEPEEDPGYVAVSRLHDGALVTALSSGPDITRDPRTLRIEPSVRALSALVRDPRLSLRTTHEVVDAGEKVRSWKGGERDPALFESVRNTDQTVVTGFVFAFAHGWRYVGPSPYKRLFGAGAIGGRAHVSAELEPVGPGYVDVLAAPRAPTWLERCLSGYSCWDEGATHFAWRPAQPGTRGDSFLLHVAPSGETVAIHVTGPRMPAGRKAALAASGFYLWGDGFARGAGSEEPWAIGLTTTREDFARASTATHG